MSHTPGPWVRDTDGFIGTETPNGWRTVADFDCDLQLDIDEREANKALAIAAPDLLEALESCYTTDGAMCWAHEALLIRRIKAINEIVRAATAKAKGEVA